ncbi:MAG: cadherin domain-containing protein [Bacteroidota bacterium]
MISSRNRLFQFLLIAFLVFPGFALAQTNLISDPGAEVGPKGDNTPGPSWSNSGNGSFEQWDAADLGIAAHSGVMVFLENSSNLNDTYMEQVVDVSGSASIIDAGGASIDFSAWLQTAGSDQGKIVVEYLNGSNSPIGTMYDSGFMAGPGAWIPLTSSGTAPAGTRYIRVRAYSKFVDGSFHDAYFDDFSLTLTSTNSAPTNISLNSTSVNQSGGTNATVGTLSTTDADGGDSHTYSLASGSGDTNNGSFNINGNTLRADNAGSLPAGNYSVRIQTNDGNGGTYQKSFTITVVDDIDPSFQNSTPSLSNITASGAQISADLDEDGTVYYVAVSDGASAPSSNQVKSGQNSSGSAALKSGNFLTSSTTGSESFTGLSADTQYDIYVVAQDQAGSPNLQSAPTKLDMRTLSNNADLSNLILSSGPLVPVFDANTTGYTAQVSYSTSSITVTPTSADAKSSITVNGSAVNSGAASNAISLSEGSNSITIKVTAEDGSTKTYTVNVTRNSPNSDGSLTAASGVSEPVALPSTIDSSPEAIDIFDFTLSDGGGGDGVGMTVSEIVINVSGTSTDAERGQVTWRLNGSDASNVTGIYNAGTDQITFSGLSISIADNSSETYTINAYYNDNSNLIEDHVFILSVDGDTDVTTGSGGTSIGSTSAITNGSGSSVDIVATQLAYTTQPSGSVSGSTLTTQPKVTAQDAFGNTDVDFTETVTITEASSGSLSGDTDIAAVSGVASFTDIAYTATADQESFTLTANDEDGTGSNLSTIDANTITSDVVATQLAFTTEPAPITLKSGETTNFTTVPVVKAVDANNTVDTGYSTDIQLSEVNGAGSATMSGTGDTDGNGSTVSLTPTSGSATFTGLALTYTAAGSSDETFNLQASSGGLTTANSATLTATVNNNPTATGIPSDITVTEDQLSDVDLSSASFSDADGNDLTLTLTVSGGSFATPADGSGVGAGVTETLVNTTTITLAGSTTDLNTYLNTASNIQYQGATNASGNDAANVTIEANDGNGSGEVTLGTVNIDITAVNDVPTVSGLVSDITFTEDQSGSVDLSASSFTDVDGDVLTVTLTVTAGTFGTPADGAGVGSGVTETLVSSTEITLVGSASDINTYLNTASNITYTGPANANGNDAETLTVQANDGNGSGDLTLGTVNIDITAVNDAPTVSSVDFSGTLVVDQQLTGSYTYSDVEKDPESGTSYQWYRSDNGSGLNKSAISGATATTYTLTSSDVGKYISFEVTPSDGSDTGSTQESGLKGTVQSRPDMDITGNSNAISDGSSTASTTNSTDFGDVVLTDGTLETTYTITNSGDLDLNLSGSPLVSISGPNAGDFTVTSQPGTSTISGGGGSTTFKITFDPSGLGSRDAEVSISSNDPDENPYTFAISGTGINTTPSFISATTTSIDENGTAALDIQANDGDGGSTDANLTYSITGGADQSLFSIDASSGALSFKTAPDYENPSDGDTNNDYEVDVQIDDGGAVNNTATQSITISVSDVDEAPVFVSSANQNVAENTSTSFLDVNANDGDGGANDANVSYQLSGGADQAEFTIDSSTGALSFDSAPDYENPTDSDSNNEYSVEITADDGTNTTTQTITVTVTNENEFAPVISSNGGGATGILTVDENQTSVTTVTATDDDANATQSYSITGGTDAGKFSIDAGTGELTFGTAPDAENATDANGDGTYEVTVQVSDGSKTDSQDLSVSIADINETTPSITSGNSTTIDENLAEGSNVIQVTASDNDRDASLTYSITSNPDGDTDKNGAFTINSSSGQITVNDADDLDRERASSVSVEVQVSDGTNTADQTITVNLNDVNEFTPVVTASQSFDVAEDASNGYEVGTVAGTDADATATLQSWAITAGNDDGLFAIDASSGQVSIADNSTLDYETATSYSITLTVSDGTNTSSAETVTVNITDVNDNAPVFTSANTADVDENQTAVLSVTTTDADSNPSVTYSVTGGADQGQFGIDGSTGELSFASAPDYENPADSDSDNEYEVTITADDGTFTTDQTITVTVQDLNDNTPVISSASSVTIDEELAVDSEVIDVEASDADPSDNLTYSITDNPNADEDSDAAFSIDASTGVVSVNDAGDLDREDAASVSLTVQVSDGTNTTDQTITVNLDDVNEFTPVVTASQSFDVAEDASNGDAVGVVAGSDADATATLQSWAITAGNDDGLFAIDASSGQVSIADNSTLDYETATSYSITLTVSDGTNTSAAETVTVNITDVNDNAPVFTSANSADVDENQTAVLSVTTTDADSNPSVTYSVTGGADQGQFSIDGSTGELSFASAPDYENPADSDSDNEYEVTITADDGTFTTDQAITVTVQDLNDNVPVISSASSVTIDEELANGSEVIDVEASDADPSDNLTYSITSNPNVDSDGDDAFSIDASTGVVSVNDAGDLDRELNESLSVEVAVSDGTNTVSQTITVDLNDVNEFKPVISSADQLEIYELKPQGTEIGTVTASDEDATASLTYTITENTNPDGDATDAVAINGQTGKLTVQDRDDFDADITSTLNITVEVSDGNHTVMQDLTITILTPPRITATVPTNQAEAVSISDDITITFDQVISAGDLSLITIETTDGDPATGVEAAVNDDKLTISHDPFLNNTSYEITIASGVVKNDDEVSNETGSLTFRTIQSAPMVTTVDPADEATAVPIDDEITVVFSQKVSLTNVDGITLADAQDQPVGNLEASVDGATLTITHDPFDNDTQYRLAIAEGALQNADQVDSKTFNSSFTSIKAPLEVVTLTPEADAGLVAIDSPIEVKFDKDVKALDLSEVRLLQGRNTINDATVSLGDSSLSITHTGLKYHTTYSVSIPAQSIANLDAVPNDEISWSFTSIMDVPEQVTLAAPEQNAGSVVLQPTLDWDDAARAAEYEWQVAESDQFSDPVHADQGITDSEITLSRNLDYYQTYFWRVRGSNEGGNGAWSNTGTFITKAAPPLLVFPADEESEISTAPELSWNSEHDGARTQVQLSMQEDFASMELDTLLVAEQLTLQNLAADQPYFWRVRINTEQTTSEWTSTFNFRTRPDPADVEEEEDVDVSFAFTSEQQSNPNSTAEKVEERDYRLIGLPGADEFALDEIFAGKYHDEWRAFFENGSTTDFYDEFDPETNRLKFEPGVGYWVLSKKLQDLKGKLSAVQTDEKDRFGIPVHEGWNIITNPFQSPVKWSDVQVENPSITVSLFGYQTQFTQAETMQPFTGYYFYNDPQVAVDTLYIPYTEIEKREEDTEQPVASKTMQEQTGELVVQATFKSGLQNRVRFVFTEHGQDRRYRDYHPDLSMARRGMLIKQEESERIAYTSIPQRYEQEGNESILQIKGNVGDRVRLNLSMQALSDQAALLLVNPVTHQSLLLDQVEPQAKFTITEPLMSLTSYVGDRDELQEIQERLLPQQIQLEPNYPNPFNPITTIRYSITEATNVQLDIFNVLGQRVQTLVSQNQQPGWHVAQFDGARMASGMYIYRLRVGNKVLTKKMMLLK